MVIQESGECEQALKHLDKYSDKISDKVTVKETYGKLHISYNLIVKIINFVTIIFLIMSYFIFLGKLRLQLQQYAEAAQVYKELLNINPENTTYYARLAEAERHAKPEETLAMLQRYEELFPRALAPRRLQLNYAMGDEFKALVDRYLRRGMIYGSFVHFERSLMYRSNFILFML